MTTADDRWGIDIKPALAALKKLRASIGLTDKKAAEGFDRSAAASKRARDEMGRFIKTSKSGGASLKGAFGGLNSAISTISTGLGGLVVGFGAVSVAGVAAFAAVTAGGISLNKEAELTRLSLIQIFEGNEGAADAFIDQIGELAIRLGTSRQELTGLAKGILPDVGTIGGTAELLENVIVLGRDAGQGIESIRIATEEALSGNLSSLGRRLNIPKKTLDSIKEYQKEMSLADAINKGLGARILETGISADVTADSFTTLQGKIEGTAENFQRILGVAPFEELKEQARDFLAVLEDQGPEIEHVAEAFGDLATKVIDFVGSNLTGFIEDIDFQQVEGLVDGISDAVDAGELLLDVFFDLDDGSLFSSLISGLTTVVGKLREAAITGAKIVAIEKASIARERAEAEAFREPLEEKLGGIGGGDISTSIRAIPGVVVDFGRALATAEEKAFAAAEGQKAYDQSIRDSLPNFEKLNETEKENERIRKDRRKVTEDTTEADKAAGEAVLANKNNLEALADAQAKAATAQEEISKKTADLEEDRQKRLTDIHRKEAQKRFDDEVKNAQKREDIARKNADSLEDIFRKQDDAIAEASKDLSREEQDIALKSARERKQIEKDAANERVEVERNFRQQLQDIQRSFNQSAQDAERTNDAQAFLQAVRARDEQIDVAKSERDVSLEDVGRGAQEQRADLKEQLAQEVEDGKIANARKIEDLNLRLEQELEAQAIKNERDLEQQAIQEERKREQRDLTAQRTLEDFERTEAEKQEKLNASLEKQFAILEAAQAKEIELTAMAEAEKTEIIESEATKRIKILSRAEVPLSKLTGGGIEDTELAKENKPLVSLTGLAEGGDIAAGQTALVGEKGIELFTAPAAGHIIPNQTMFSPPGAAPGMAPNVNNSRNLSVGEMGINPGDGVLSRMVQNEMTKMMELLG